METAAVLVDTSQGIARITLNAPNTANALDLRMANGLHDAFRSAAEDDDVRVVLLAGAGGVFCAGGDLRAMQAAEDRGDFVLSLAQAAHDAVRLMAGLDKPIVAAVQGSAAGAGLSLVLLSDIVVASSTSTYTTAYARVGLTPDCGQSWLLPRAVGTSRAVGLTLESRAITAAEAESIGLVSHVVDDGTELGVAQSIAARLADGPAHAYGQARALIRGSSADGFEAHLQREAVTIAAAAAEAATGVLVDAFVHGAPAVASRSSRGV